MIDRTKHWDPLFQKNQKDLLDSLPEDKRDFMAYTMRTTNASLHYYRELEADPTEEDFEEWLNILPDNLSQAFRKDGYEKCKGVLALRRHTAERNDVGMSEYMRQALSIEDFNRWMESVNDFE